MAKIHMPTLHKKKSQEQQLAMSDEAFQRYRDRRIKHHPEEQAEFLEVFNLRWERDDPASSPTYARKSALLGDDWEDRVVAPKGDPYTYKLFTDGSIEILSGPDSVGKRFAAGSKAAKIVASAAKLPSTNVSGFVDDTLNNPATTAAIGAGLGWYFVGGPMAVVLGGVLGWCIGKRTTQPAAKGLTYVGNVGDDDYWGDTAWNEADEQRFYRQDEFGSNYNLPSYGY